MFVDSFLGNSSRPPRQSRLSRGTFVKRSVNIEMKRRDSRRDIETRNTVRPSVTPKFTDT